MLLEQLLLLLRVFLHQLLRLLPMLQLDLLPPRLVGLLTRELCVLEVVLRLHALSVCFLLRVQLLLLLQVLALEY